MDRVEDKTYNDIIINISNMIYSLMNSNFSNEEYINARNYIKEIYIENINILNNNSIDTTNISNDIRNYIDKLSIQYKIDMYNATIESFVEKYDITHEYDNEYLVRCINFLKEKECICTKAQEYKFIDEINSLTIERDKEYYEI